MVETVTDLELAKNNSMTAPYPSMILTRYGQGAAIRRGTYCTPEQIAAAQAEEQDNRSSLKKRQR